MREGHYTPHIFFRALVDSRFSSEYRKSLPEPINSTFNSWNIMVERTGEVFLFLYHSLACTFPFFLIFPFPFPRIYIIPRIFPYFCLSSLLHFVPSSPIPLFHQLSSVPIRFTPSSFTANSRSHSPFPPLYLLNVHLYHC